MTMKRYLQLNSISMTLLLLAFNLPGIVCALDECARCRYCVEGKCVPNAQTFGHYETAWRRWPVENAEVLPPRKGGVKADPSLGPTTEVPAPDAETDLAPEFPHLKERADPKGAKVPKELAPAEIDTTLPPATELPDQNAPAADPFSDEKDPLPPGEANRKNRRGRQASRPTRLGMGWVVDSHEAQPVSFVQDASAFPQETAHFNADFSNAAVNEADSDRRSGDEDSNPLRIQEAMGKPNVLRTLQVVTAATYPKPARENLPLAPVAPNPLRKR